MDNGAIYMLDIQNYIGTSSSEADRKRIYRDKILNEQLVITGICPDKKSDKCPDKKSDKPTPEIELEKELKKEKELKIKYAEFVTMKETEYQKLLLDYGAPFTNKCIEVLDNYKGSKGTTYKDDYRAILSWVVKRVQEDFNKEGKNGVIEPDTELSEHEKRWFGR
jgi:hypothetical protein